MTENPNTKSERTCQACGGYIDIIRSSTEPVWIARCDCTKVCHPHLTGITLRLKREAIRKKKQKGENAYGHNLIPKQRERKKVNRNSRKGRPVGHPDNPIRDGHPKRQGKPK